MIQPPAWRLLPVSTHFYARKEGRKCWGAPPSLGDPRPRTEAGLTTVTLLGGPAGGPALASLPRTVAPPARYRAEAQRVTPRRPRSRFGSLPLPCPVVPTDVAGPFSCTQAGPVSPSPAPLAARAPQHPGKGEQKAGCICGGSAPRNRGPWPFGTPPPSRAPLCSSK